MTSLSWKNTNLEGIADGWRHEVHHALHTHGAKGIVTQV